MGIVGGPHDVLHSDELPAGYPYPISDERREDLAPEVFTRRELQRRRIEIPVLFLGLVQLLQKEGQPAHLVLCRDELQVGEPLQHAGEDQHDQRALHLMAEDGRTDVAVQGLFDRQAAFRAHARDAVQADRNVDLLRRSPEGIVVGRAVGPVFRRGSPDEGALQTSTGTASQLLRRLVDVIQGDQPKTGQPLRRIGTVLGQPVVVDTETGALQRRVCEPELAKSKGRVDHVRLDAVEIHVLDALGRVPAAGTYVLVRRSLKEPRELLGLLSGPHALGKMDGSNSLQHEIGYRTLRGLVLHHPWRALAELLVDALHPEVARLVHVRIGGNKLRSGMDPPPLPIPTSAGGAPAPRRPAARTAPARMIAYPTRAAHIAWRQSRRPSDRKSVV